VIYFDHGGYRCTNVCTPRRRKTPESEWGKFDSEPDSSSRTRRY
jgi:hypothetical protein